MSGRSSLVSASPEVLDAAVRRVPITGGVERVSAPEGSTLAEFVSIAFPVEAHRRFVVVSIDGEEIAPEAWERVPRAGEHVQLAFRPGGKDFLRTILQIAVIAVAVWVSGGALGGWFAAGTWQAAVAAAGVSILGNLAINALIPLPKPGTIEAPPPYYSLSNARNSSRPWGPVPMLFGTHRIVAPRMSEPFQEVFGGVTYLRVALCLGLCPMEVSDWKIGETALSSYSGVEMEVRLNENDPAHTLITGDPVQESIGATLNHTEWTERTTATDVDEIEVIYDFPSGLGGLDSKGRKTSRTVNLRLQYRPTGSSEDWSDWRPTVPQANTASAGAGAPFRPDYFTLEGDLVAWRGQLGGMGGVASDIVPITRSDPGRAFRHSERFAVPRGQYDVRTQRTEAVSTDPNVSDAVSWGILGSIRSQADPFPNRKLATACFRIKATEQLSNMVDTLNCIASSLQPVFSDEALADPTIASAAEFTDVETSSNPAILALLAARGPNTAFPKPDAEIDWPSFAAAAAKATARGLTFNEYVETSIGRWEMVRRILAAMHARPVKHNGKLSVVVDDSKAGQPPAQVFSPRNVRNFRWQKTYPRLPHAIRTPFANAANNWGADEVTVFMPGYTAETATRYETVAMPGKTDADEIRTVVNQYARNGHFQTESFEFETDAEHLTVKRGDYCVVQHFAMATGLGAARIRSRELNGSSEVTAIILDRPVETPEGESLAVQWRTIVADSGLARMEVLGEQAVTRDAANPKRFVFTTPQAGDTKPAAAGEDYEGDIALVGIAGKVSFEVLVRDIAPRPHLQAAISCIAYAGERFVDAPEWPAHDPRVTLPYAPRPPAPVLQSAIAGPLEIAVAFTQAAMPRGLELQGYVVARREHGAAADSWEPLGQLRADERVAIAPAGEPGAKYDVRIVGFGRREDGATVYSDALIVAEVEAATAPAAPAGCGGAFTTRTSSGGAQQLVLTATWTANENPDVLDTLVEQRVSTGPDVWQEIGRGAAATGRTEIHGLPVGRAYVLGFTNISKRGAPSTRTTISSITAPDTLVATGALTAVPGSALDLAIGDMATAAASASAAATHAATAATAAANAAIAQAAAEDALDAAEDEAADALASASAAAASQAAASGSASAAAGSATSASSSQTAAAGSATAAASSASAAAASASSAAGSASAASTSASAASTSASDAATSASSAQTSSVSARAAAASAFPSTFENQTVFTTSTDGLTPTPFSQGDIHFSSVSGEGIVYTTDADAGALAALSAFRPVSGRTYKVASRVRVTVNPTVRTTDSWVGFRTMDATGVGVTFSGTVNYFGMVAADGWRNISHTVTGDTLLTLGALARPIIFLNWNDGGVDGTGNYTTDSTMQAAYLKFEDITESTAAGTSAAASASSASSAAASQSAAASSASAASTSATNAATQASNAATSASQASTSETNAAGSASTASTAATNAAASQSAAAGSATAASGSASTASTQAGNAGTSASAAASSATAAAASASSASSSASTATSQASAASASAASASSSATLSATFAAGSQGSINSSATFADNTNATGVPTGWVDWSWATADGQRVTGTAPHPYAYQQTGRAGSNSGIRQVLEGRIAPGWYVIEADAELISGTFVGAGAFLYSVSSGGDQSLQISFYSDADISGSAPGNGSTGKIYRFRKLVHYTHAAPSSGWPALYAAPHWDNFGSVASANSIKFHRVAMRAASQAEIEARQATLDLVTANTNIATNAATSASNAASIASLTTTVSSNHAAVMAPSTNLIPYPNGTARTNPAGEGVSTSQQGWTVTGGAAGGGFVNGYWDPAGGAILYNAWGSGYSSGADRFYYIDIPISYWGWYTFAFDGYVSNLDTTKVQYYVQALDGSNTWLGEVSALFSASSGRRSISFNAPSGTEKLRISFRIIAHTSPSAGAYADLVMRALQLEHGQVATKFNEAGRIIAGERRIGAAEADIATTASTLATESAARALLETNLRASLGSGADNLVINTDFYNGLEGWIVGWDGNSGLPVDRGFADTSSIGGSPGAYSGAIRTAFVHIAGSPADGTVADAYTTRAWSDLSELKRWAVRVPGAVRLYASMYMSAHRGKARLIIGEFDANGTLITDANSWDGTPNHNYFNNGNPANAERVGGFFTTNANTRYLVMIPRLVGVSGQNDPYLFFGWAMIAMASAQQTVAPPYVSGGEDRRLYADLKLLSDAYVDGTTGLAIARFVLEAAASGGRPARFSIYSDSQGTSDAAIDAARIFFGDNTVWEDAHNTFYTEAGGERLRFGGPFGSSGNLFMWRGSAIVALNSETKANAKFAIATDEDLPIVDGSTITTPTIDDQTKTGNAVFNNVTTSGTTVHTLATIDLTVGASGYLELLSPLFFGALSINAETGMTLSAGTDWFGQMIITEQLQSGGTEHTLWTIPLQISDTGGGFFDFIFDPPVNKVIAQNVSGASRYRIKLQRTSGSNNVSGNGLQGVFTVRRTP